MSILTVRNLNKSIGKKQILSNVSLDVKQGEIMGLLGPNGSGKTTLIRTIVGLVQKDDGEVSIGGENIQSQFSRAISQVGAIIENPEFYDYLTGHQNLVHFARMNGALDEKRIDEVVELVDLSSAIHSKVGTYSLGMRQRLGIAQAILHRPALLILDEPTNGLDPAGMKELRTYLRKLCDEEGVSILIATHLLKEIEALCERVAIIQRGKVIAIQDMRTRASNEQVTVNITAEPLEEVKTWLKGAEYAVQVVNNDVIVHMQYQDIPVLTKGLVEAGIHIYRIEPLAPSLEDSFLALTGGNEDDELN
ncbi:ABC transporter ATP-binding protein [Priestia koreensis]|uniref:ABC transporter ATP-binding protein n=1 Tax=Priestia koreensis TaxID=284581 RepID=UPI001F5A9517|nr:ABC transporter ATP-binding protein [Priestia koreensis]UNL86650.1 ABC transporter ATP-binding protein [Priestia koreensis]